MFKLLKTDGSSYSILHSFAFNFVDGGNPFASLILDDAGFLYGTNFNGGNGDGGTIFRLKTDGTNYEILHHFVVDGLAGDGPIASLILDGANNLYGTTRLGGKQNVGTVFTLTTTGTGFALLHDFGDKLPRNGPTADGTSPGASLILDDAGFLYGTTSAGGSAGLGTIFRLPIPDQLRADIAFVSKTDTPDPVTVRTLLTYSLVFVNNGPGVAFLTSRLLTRCQPEFVSSRRLWGVPTPVVRSPVRLGT